MPTTPSTEYIRKLFNYDKNTGDLIWKTTKNSRATKGKIAGVVTAKGYLQIGIDGNRYLAHRLVLAWHEIEHSSHTDHIDGNKLNNRIENLRVATPSVNTQNIKSPTARNTTGFLGIEKMKNGRYRAQISVMYKKHELGFYDTPEEAHQVYLIAKRKLHEGCTI